MNKKINESVNNCGAPSVLICNLEVTVHDKTYKAQGAGSTYEIARANAYKELATLLLEELCAR